MSGYWVKWQKNTRAGPFWAATTHLVMHPVPKNTLRLMVVLCRSSEPQDVCGNRGAVHNKRYFPFFFSNCEGQWSTVARRISDFFVFHATQTQTHGCSWTFFPSRLTYDWTRACAAGHLSISPENVPSGPPLVPIHPTPTPEVKPYSWINLAAVWPNVHWHTSPHLSPSHTVSLSCSPSLPGGLLHWKMERVNLYSKE